VDRPEAYKHRFRRWGIKKRITTQEKNSIIKRHSKRTRADASTSDITIIQGGLEKAVDRKQLKRYIGDQIRRRPERMMLIGTCVDSDLSSSISQKADSTLPGSCAGTSHTRPWLAMQYDRMVTHHPLVGSRSPPSTSWSTVPRMHVRLRSTAMHLHRQLRWYVT